MCNQFVHGCSRMTIDPRTPTMPGRSMSGFHHQADIAGGGGGDLLNAGTDNVTGC